MRTKTLQRKPATHPNRRDSHTPQHHIFIGSKLAPDARKNIGAKVPGHHHDAARCEHCTCGDEDRLERTEHGQILLYEPVPTLIVAKRHLGSRHILLRVEAHADYEPGQFFQVTKLGYGEAPISIASYSKEHIDLVVNPVGTVTQEVVRLHPGEQLLLRGPFGYGYPMQYFYNNTLVLIGGGCGVAPLKGVLDYVMQHRNHFRDVLCFFGYREPKEAIFVEEIRKWEEAGLLKQTCAYSQPPPGFTGNTGYLNTYLEQTGMDNHGKVALICGPTPMMLSSGREPEKTRLQRRPDIHQSRAPHEVCDRDVRPLYD